MMERQLLFTRGRSPLASWFFRCRRKAFGPKSKSPVNTCAFFPSRMRKGFKRRSTTSRQRRGLHPPSWSMTSDGGRTEQRSLPEHT